MTGTMRSPRITEKLQISGSSRVVAVEKDETNEETMRSQRLAALDAKKNDEEKAASGGATIASENEKKETKKKEIAEKKNEKKVSARTKKARGQ